MGHGWYGGVGGGKGLGGGGFGLGGGTPVVAPGHSPNASKRL